MSKKITQLESATDVTASDFVQIVDIEDSDMAASGTNKKATAQLLANELGKLTNVTATGSTTARSLANRFADTVNVKDFGAVGDGVTDDTASIQAAINAIPQGGKVTFPKGKYYCASSVIVYPNVWLEGPLGSVGNKNTNYNEVNGTIYLNSSATLDIRNNTAVTGFQILNANLRGNLPFANDTIAAAAVSNFSGIGITVKGSDVFLEQLLIAGFSTAIKSNDGSTNFYRQKFDWISIDCTNGIDIFKSADIPRIYNVHCWPFLTFGNGLEVCLRTGAAFKVASNFDAGSFTNCFAWGYSIGFDISAIVEVTLLNCFVDGWALRPTSTGSIGVKTSGSVRLVKIIGGGYLAQDIAVQHLSTSSLIISSAAQFFGNRLHISTGASSGYVSINGCGFGSGNWGGSTAIVHASNTPLQLTSNQFINMDNAIAFSSATALESSVIWGNYSDGSTSLPSERTISTGDSGISKVFTAYSDSVLGPRLDFLKSRGTSVSKTSVNTGDFGAYIASRIYAGSTWNFNAGIRAVVEGSPSDTSSGGSWYFSTVADGSTTLTDRIRIHSNGALIPITDNSYALGASGARWSAVWAANGAIQTSDERTKTSIETSQLGLDFINDLQPVSYKFSVGGNKVIRQVYRDAEGNEVSQDTEGAIPSEILTEEIEGQRTHYGLLAQQVKAAIPEGVDFGGWILTDKDDPESQQGLRYDQFIAPLIKAVQELTARVVELESK
jgi:hypothetical protein